jgi:uncharacterized protein YbjT (DUF2867 family)
MEGALRLGAQALRAVGEALGIPNLDNDPGKIFVTGGTGVIGHRVAMRLLKAGYKDVRFGCHPNTAQLNDLAAAAEGAEVVEFAWDDDASYEPALRGVKSVLCTIPYSENWWMHFPTFLRACKSAGVKHIIKVSFYHARVAGDEFQDVPLVKHHGQCDEMLIHMVQPPVHVDDVHSEEVDVAADYSHPKMSYTILYASHLMSNPFTFQGAELRDTNNPSTLYGSSHNMGINYVSPNDVAEAAVRCLLEPRMHYDKEYTLTGPEAITDNQVADLLSKYLMKPIMYVDQPLRIFREEVKKLGDPDWMVEDLLALEKIKAMGKEEDNTFISHDFQKICGRQAESFETYLRQTDMMVPLEEGGSGDLKPYKPVAIAH